MDSNSSLREKRRQLGLSQERAGQLLGVAQSSISRLESGKQSPSLWLALKIEKILGLDVSCWGQNLKPGRGQLPNTPEAQADP